MAEELAEKRAEFEKQAKEIINTMEGKENKQIRNALAEAHIPQPIIDELAPAEDKPVEGATAAPPAK